MEGIQRRLSAGQEAMWFVHRMAPDSAAYNITLAFRVRTRASAPLDVPALRRAVTALAGRHEVLRSTFAEEEAGPVRLVGPADLVALDVREVAGADEARLHDLVGAVGAEPFRLTTQAPLRVVLLRRAPDDAVLVVVAHHIVSDRTSQWLIMRDLLDAYCGLAASGRPAWRPLKASFDDHVVAERQMLASPRRAELEERWSRLCAGVPAAELPADRPRPARQTFGGATHRVTFPADLDRRLRENAERAGVTPFVQLLGIFQALLHRYGGQPEFLIGCPVATRFGGGMRDVVGYLVNTVALRAAFTPDTTFAQAVESAQRQMRDAVGVARYPFPLVPGALDLPREQDRPPVFQIAATMVATSRLEPLLDLLADDAAAELEYGGLRLSIMDVAHMEGQLDLNVELRRSRNSLTAVLRYNTDLFDLSTIERLGDHFLLLARAAVEEPGARIGAVSLMTADELRGLLRLGQGAAAL
ncbi:condensation domain-containing protein [Actinomadura macra]|uniref:condensation domain-containing protein n=1 Tax=Actinomadura macra TaxID=46164 RepID=UPI000829FFAA|nr:condensation domain-containing protein [Actinomadura macra]